MSPICPQKRGIGWPQVAQPDSGDQRISAGLACRVTSWHREMAPRAGFEPATNRLTVDCSTAELPRNSPLGQTRSEEHTSELQSLMRISYAVFCLKKNKTNKTHTNFIY